MTARVSILIPTRNRAALLGAALRSALAQDHPDLEIIVGDNASTDGTAEVLAGFQDPRLRIIRRPVDLGMVGNWRDLIEVQATGTWFLILSDDDTLDDPTYLSRAAVHLDDPDVSLVYAGGVIHDVRDGSRRELRLPWSGRVPGTTVLASRGAIQPQDFTLCNVLFRREVAHRLRCFEDPWNLSCDSELFLGSCLEGDVAVVDGLVSTYLVHGGNLILRLASDERFLRANPAFALRTLRRARGRVNPAVLERFTVTTAVRTLETSAMLLAVHYGSLAVERAWRDWTVVDAGAVAATRTWRFRLTLWRVARRIKPRVPCEPPEPTGHPRVEVLVATYHGAAWIRQQLDSLLAQTWPNLGIIVSDDGSQDDTPRILAEYQARHPDRIRVLPDAGRVGGIIANFNRLAAHSTAPYLCFCDQDDEWHPEHVALGVQEVRRLEARFPGLDLPCLVHSDLTLIDATGQVIAPSMWEFQHLDPATTGRPERVMTQNVVTGCTVTVNRAALDAAFPVPAEAVVHDWWLAIICAGRGATSYLHRPLVRYRQHAANAVGAKRYRHWLITFLLTGKRPMGDAKASRNQTARQAGAIAALGGEDRLARLSGEYAKLSEVGWLARRRIIIANGFLKIGFWRNLSWLYRS